MHAPLSLRSPGPHTHPFCFQDGHYAREWDQAGTLPTRKGMVVFRGKHWIEPLRRGAWPHPSLPTTSIWKRRETERFGSCQSLNTSPESARKIAKASPSVEGAGGAHGHLHSLFAICFSLFVFSCRVSNFHFSFPRRMRTDCPIEASKWCFGFCLQR